MNDINTEDIQIDEEKLNRYFEKRKKEISNKFFNNLKTKIRRYFYSVIYEFNRWKKLMKMSDHDIEIIMKSNDPYIKFWLDRPYSNGDGKTKTQWYYYCRMDPNPTIQGFIEYMEIWVPGRSYSVPMSMNSNASDIFNGTQLHQTLVKLYRNGKPGRY